MATIVNKVGTFLLDCIAKKDGLTVEAINWAKEKFEIVLILAYKCLDQDCVAVSLNVIELLNHYLSILKHATTLVPAQLNSVLMLLKITFARIQYPKWYLIDHCAGNYNSMEEMYNYFRSELSGMLANMLNIQSINVVILEQIKNMIIEWKKYYAVLTVPQKELPLFLFYKAGESFKDLTSAIKNGILGGLIEEILSVPEIFTENYLIICSTLDLIVRYSCYFDIKPDKITDILSVFLFEKYFSTIQQ